MNILDIIGNTPIVELQNITKNLPHQVSVKLEYLNPGGSYKDRIAKYMLDTALTTGRLKPGGTIVACTSGNTGAGMALWAAVKGFRCIFTISDKQSPDKIDFLRNFGAEVVVCPSNVAPDDERSYYSVAQKIARENDNTIYIDQYNDILNRETHYKTMGPEIWEQTKGEVDIIFFPVGTGGLVSGSSQFLKQKAGNKIQTVAVDAKGSVIKEYVRTGKIGVAKTYMLEGVGADFIPKNFDFSVIDYWVEVADKDAFLMTRRMLKKEGIYAGGSSGMVVFGALQFLKNIQDPKRVLVILCDSGNRYTNKLYNDEWMRENNFLL